MYSFMRCKHFSDEESAESSNNMKIFLDLSPKAKRKLNFMINEGR